jgi:hypothetical protein
VYRWWEDAKSANCESGIELAATNLSKRLVSGTGSTLLGLVGLGGSIATGGFTRVADGLSSVFKYAKTKVTPPPPTAIGVAVQGATGTTTSTTVLTSGLGGSVSRASMPGFQWISGISRNFKLFQGDPWEVFVQSKLGPGAFRFVKQNFKTFDHAVPLGGGKYRAVSSKTLDTLTTAKLKDPSAVGSTLRRYVNHMRSFTSDVDSNGFVLNAAMIVEREMQLAVPSGTTGAQWAEIGRVIADALAGNPKVKIVVSVIH